MFRTPFSKTTSRRTSTSGACTRHAAGNSGEIHSDLTTEPAWIRRTYPRPRWRGFLTRMSRSGAQKLQNLSECVIFAVVSLLRSYIRHGPEGLNIHAGWPEKQTWKSHY